MFSYKNIIVSALLLVLVPSHIHGRPDGAPNTPSVCASMIPEHGFDEQSNLASPFSTEIPSGLTAHMDSTIRLELRSQNGQSTFKGFLIMAFDTNSTADVKPIGTFKLPSNGKMIDCLDGVQNAATHTNRDLKNLVTVDWVPPAGFTGNVTFRTTYVKSVDIYWVKTESKVVSFVTPVPTVKPATDSTTTAKPNSAPQSSNTWTGIIVLSLVAVLMR